MLKYFIKTTETLKRLRADQDGVVSFEYIIVAACVITIVITFFTGPGNTSISAALNTAVGKITAAMAAL
jgi:pilus assembly protein Flp/PilA